MAAASPHFTLLQLPFGKTTRRLDLSMVQQPRDSEDELILYIWSSVSTCVPHIVPIYSASKSIDVVSKTKHISQIQKQQLKAATTQYIWGTAQLSLTE